MSEEKKGGNGGDKEQSKIKCLQIYYDEESFEVLEVKGFPKNSTITYGILDLANKMAEVYYARKMAMENLNRAERRKKGLILPKFLGGR